MLQPTVKLERMDMYQAITGIEGYAEQQNIEGPDATQQDDINGQSDRQVAAGTTV